MTQPAADAPTETTAETTEAAEPRRSLWWEIRRRLIVAAVLWVLYTLSIGPMYWTWFGSKFNQQGVLWALVYEPLYLVCHWVPPFGRLVDAYVMLWI